MDEHKLKVKVGEHEFEASGAVEIVQAQFDEFKELIRLVASAPQAKPSPIPAAIQSADALPHLPLEKILKVDGRVVSLTAKCDSIDEAVLLILLGQKES